MNYRPLSIAIFCLIVGGSQLSYFDWPERGDATLGSAGKARWKSGDFRWGSAVEDQRSSVDAGQWNRTDPGSWREAG